MNFGSPFLHNITANKGQFATDCYSFNIKYPGAKIISFDDGKIEEIDYEESGELKFQVHHRHVSKTLH